MSHSCSAAKEKVTWNALSQLVSKTGFVLQVPVHRVQPWGEKWFWGGQKLVSLGTALQTLG